MHYWLDYCINSQELQLVVWGVWKFCLCVSVLVGRTTSSLCPLWSLWWTHTKICTNISRAHSTTRPACFQSIWWSCLHVELHTRFSNNSVLYHHSLLTKSWLEQRSRHSSSVQYCPFSCLIRRFKGLVNHLCKCFSSSVFLRKLIFSPSAVMYSAELQGPLPPASSWTEEVGGSSPADRSGCQTSLPSWRTRASLWWSGGGSRVCHAREKCTWHTRLGRVARSSGRGRTGAEAPCRDRNGRHFGEF